VKTGGGVSGHNGLRSLSAHIGNDYVRVRIGVGHPGQRDLVVGHVLHDFAKSDYTWLEPVLGAIAAEAPYLAEGDTERFQSRVAHAVQAESPAKPAPRTKPGPRGKEPPVEKKTEPQGSLAEKLRRWFGA
jgi:PTH1 family peptidyl-tRNA hydrolase